MLELIYMCWHGNQTEMDDLSDRSMELASISSRDCASHRTWAIDQTQACMHASTCYSFSVSLHVADRWLDPSLSDVTSSHRRQKKYVHLYTVSYNSSVPNLIKIDVCIFKRYLDACNEGNRTITRPLSISSSRCARQFHYKQAISLHTRMWCGGLVPAKLTKQCSTDICNFNGRPTGLGLGS